jgi:hypothetical protein
MTMMTLLLAVLLGSGAGAGQATEPAATGSTLVLPGDRGHVLKMTREMIELAKSHDPDRRVDLFLAHARERLREREALEGRAGDPRRRAVGASLGRSYDRLLTQGAAGAIECGATEGRDMNGAVARVHQAAQIHRETWTRVLSGVAPADRADHEWGLRAAEQASERARAAQAAGGRFLAEERAKAERLRRERERAVAPAPHEPERPHPQAEKPPVRKPEDPVVPHPEPERKPHEPDSKPREPDPPPPHEHHHPPHRPHR